ncbi:ABC transporter permease [Rhizobium sp. FKL33]|uniref:ABC transporter permease n=1 Tax=Rhizobium sp. FKL33 TaxID=2562307 RepID=UPI0010C0DF91|nr:ABC transporter permease [Rhizobium sp. FKL33]
MLNSAYLIRRQAPGAIRTALGYLFGLLIGLGLSAAILMSVGVPAADLLQEFIVQTFMTSDGLAQTMTSAAPLILVGLASAIAMRIRFWNIGVEGQIWMGAIAATWVALHHIGPPSLRLPIGLAAAFAAGALSIWPWLWMKTRYGVSEVITTLLSASIAFLLVQHLLFGVWRDPANSFPITVEFPLESQFSMLGWGQVHMGLALALVVAALVYFLLERSPFGYIADAIGFNRRTAMQTGLPVATVSLVATLSSGGLSGLAGAVILSGTEHRLSQALSSGYLFSAIVIAYLGRSRPVWVVFVAIALAAIYTAGNVLKVFYGVSEAVIVLAQGTVLMSVLTTSFFSAYTIHFPVKS